MQLGLGVLRIAPRDFWTQSMREWVMTMEGHRIAQGSPEAPLPPMKKDELESLMTRYPDKFNG